MLAASPSPRLNASTSPNLSDSSGFLSARSHRRCRSTKSASPIVKPHSAHVYSYSSTSTISNTTPIQTAVQTSSQCPSTEKRFPPQPPTSSSQPYCAVSKSTQTSPSHPEQPDLVQSTKVQMVDAGTQCSPRLQSQTRLNSSAASSTTTPSTPAPAAQIASLQIHEANPTSNQASALPSVARSTSSTPNAHGAVSVAPAGTLTSSTLSHTTPQMTESTIASREPRPTPSQQYPTKRNHSVAAAADSAPHVVSTRPQDTSDPAKQASTSIDEEKLKSDMPSKKMRAEEAPTKRMPLDYSTCETRDLVLLISSMLMELVRYNDTIPLRDGHLTRFHSRAPPGISVLDYLQRLTTHATLSPPILLSIVYYIDKLCALYPAFTISSLTVHRFLITAATVASKGLSDSFWTNKVYARVGGVSMKELALLELEFLVRVQWRIVPQPEVLVDYYKSLVGRTVGYELEETKEQVKTGPNEVAVAAREAG